MKEWLKQLNSKDRERERKIAVENALRIFSHTGNESWKTFALEIRDFRF